LSQDECTICQTLLLSAAAFAGIRWLAGFPPWQLMVNKDLLVCT
jgi:hypothetical protein